MHHIYYGCNKCKAFAESNPDAFFNNEGRCPDCMDDHESMINHPEWWKPTIDFGHFGERALRGWTKFPRGMKIEIDKLGLSTFCSNEFHGEIDQERLSWTFFERYIK